MVYVPIFWNKAKPKLVPRRIDYPLIIRKAPKKKYLPPPILLEGILKASVYSEQEFSLWANTFTPFVAEPIKARVSSSRSAIISAKVPNSKEGKLRASVLSSKEAGIFGALKISREASLSAKITASKDGIMISKKFGFPYPRSVIASLEPLEKVPPMPLPKEDLEIFELLDALAMIGEPKPNKPGDYLRFRTQMDAKVCPICAPLNGRLLPIPDYLVPFGLSTSPPVHPNCRCALEFEIWIVVNPLGVPGGGIPQEIA